MNGRTTNPARTGDHAIDVDPVGVVHVEIAHVDVGDGDAPDARASDRRFDRTWT